MLSIHCMQCINSFLIHLERYSVCSIPTLLEKRVPSLSKFCGSHEKLHLRKARQAVSSLFSSIFFLNSMRIPPLPPPPTHTHTRWLFGHVTKPQPKLGSELSHLGRGALGVTWFCRHWVLVGTEVNLRSLSPAVEHRDCFGQWFVTIGAPGHSPAGCPFSVRFCFLKSLAEQLA